MLNECLRSLLSVKFGFTFSDHKCFGLSEEIRCKHLLMLVVVDWVVGFGSEDEIGGNELRTLVEQLIEGVLGIGGGFSKEDGAGSVFDHLAVAGDTFTIRFHRELLKVGREAMKVLIKAKSIST